jgi:serralysin
VTFSSTSQNPTNSGADTNRAISWTVSDSLNSGAAASSLTVANAVSGGGGGNTHPAMRAPIDFNGDSISDALWRNSNGTLATWLMSGSAITSSASPTYQGNAVSPDSSWSVAGIGDFNGGSDADILWRQATSGTLADWTMNGATIASSASLTFQGTAVTPDSTWTVVGVGDFNGDGKTDLLWRQSGTGTLADWSMNGSTVTSSAGVTYQGSAVAPNSTWSVAGVGDFNGDGKSDLLWRQSTTEALAEWQMNGATISASAGVTYQGAAVTPDSSWSVAGVGDFNNDGKEDLLWRQGTTGSLAMWLMNGSTIVSSATVTFQGSAVKPDSSWNIVEIGDFNGSSSDSDVLWRQSTTGSLVEWQMSGAQIVSSQTITSQGAAVTPNNTWQTQGKPTDFV